MKSYAGLVLTIPYDVVRQNRWARVRAGVLPLTDDLPRGRRPARSTGPVSNSYWLESLYFTPLKCYQKGRRKDSVANVSLSVALDKGQVTERTGKLSRRQLEAVLAGIDFKKPDGH